MMWGMTNTTSTPTERRRALRDLIEQAATDNRFDMWQWAISATIPARTPADAADMHNDNPCGTVANPAGWAVTLMTPDELDWLRAESRIDQARLVAAWLDIPTDAFHVEEWWCVGGPLAAAASQITAERPLTRREQAEAFCHYLDSLD